MSHRTDNRRIFFAPSPRLTFLAGAAPVAADPRAPVTAPGRPAMLAGYAILWNVPSSDRGGYRVRLLPNSATFTKPCHALYHHEFAGGPLGSTGNGTLRLFPDQTGVRVEIDLPATQLGRDVGELVRRGDVTGMSFAMVDKPQGDTVTEKGTEILNVRRFTCDEVTITAVPAFAETTIGVAGGGPFTTRQRHELELERLRFEFLTLPPLRK